MVGKTARRSGHNFRLTLVERRRQGSLDVVFLFPKLFVLGEGQHPFAMKYSCGVRSSGRLGLAHSRPLAGFSVLQTGCICLVLPFLSVHCWERHYPTYVSQQ